MTTSASAATVDSNALAAECTDVYVPLCHPGISSTNAGLGQPTSPSFCSFPVALGRVPYHVSHVRARSSAFSSVVCNTIVYSELWQTSPSSPSAAQLTQWARESALSQGYEHQANDFVARYCLYAGTSSDDTCAGRPSVHFTYEQDVYWNQTATIPSGASVVMFAGGLDFQTPTRRVQCVGGDDIEDTDIATDIFGQANAYADDLDDSLALAATPTSVMPSWWVLGAVVASASLAAWLWQALGHRHVGRHEYAPVTLVHVVDSDRSVLS
ncbi:hypothetical protein H310_03494 [Aphanomyces invadans]|uniref:Uncharacterized protein n=1 Tax=Aphanomyces invadans TaxID=157072 RepID=A0A024UHY3_9STRA|nr:hypothetical protein H310_03494 [Aphanomyces invadans]ETW05815.1 hypothetical protein H310_03494 [Aphanomyces invadans]|eukprot:XP_008865592.1 hypothetical protein H310_03494 [Aphanomyces invadans]